MNLIHFLGGDPYSCSGLVRTLGRPVTKDDLQEGPEGIGKYAGREVHARYELRSGLIATFDSYQNEGTAGAGFGLQIVGSECIIGIRCDRDPLAHLIPGNPFLPTEVPRPWIPITSGGAGKPEDRPEVVMQVHNHVLPVRDLIAAVDANREPLCGVKDGATTVEMICAVIESHRQGGKAVKIPLEERGNPFLKLPKNPHFRVPDDVAPGALGIPDWDEIDDWEAHTRKRFAIPVEGKPGYYLNPYTLKEIDLRGTNSGVFVRDWRDDDSRLRFRVP